MSIDNATLILRNLSLTHSLIQSLTTPGSTHKAMLTYPVQQYCHTTQHEMGRREEKGQTTSADEMK